MGDSDANVRVRAVVVDDQAYARTGVSLILDSDDGIEVVGEADSGEAAIAVVAAELPDVVLMDVRMPGMGGIQATRIITERHPATRVIVFTTFDLDDYAFGGLRAGASAFLLKSATPEALVDAVNTVASGAAVVEPRVTSRLIEHYLESGQASRGSAPGGALPGGAVHGGSNPGVPALGGALPGSGAPGSALPGGAAPGDRSAPANTRRAWPGWSLRQAAVTGAGPSVGAAPEQAGTAAHPHLDSLSNRERDIFRGIVRGLTNAEIAAELHLAQSTVKSHINSVFAKLQLRDRVHAVILGYELGVR